MIKILKISLLVIVSLIAAIIIVSYIIWLTYPSVKLDILIMDKTVHNMEYSQHRSFVWMLNNARILKKDGSNYNVSSDFYGFHPLKPISEKQYNIKRITLETIDSLANASDATYFTDTYGVYFNEWFRGFRRGGENSVIEGGINQNDYLFLKAMKDKKKLIIGEYNILWGTTSELNRYKTEEIFGIHTTGWCAKYFESLDTNKYEDLLDIALKYKTTTGNKWEFSGAGIVFVKQDQVVVLENEVHLNTSKPYITCSDSVSKKFKIPSKISFLDWIEVNQIEDTVKALANYNFDLTDKGKQVMDEMGIPVEFPAIATCEINNNHIYYFSGDFSNNKVFTFYSRLANSRKLIKSITINEKKAFFNDFYFPLTENILLNYSKTKK